MFYCLVDALKGYIALIPLVAWSDLLLDMILPTVTRLGVEYQALHLSLMLI